MDKILGIDISKLTFDIALLIEKRVYCKKFSNTPGGFKKLSIWLNDKGVIHSHACLEATGKYGDRLAIWLQDNGHKVSVVNPFRIKSFGQSELTRNKSDKSDAKLIARFCKNMNPDEWVPPSKEIRELRDWVSRAADLTSMMSQEKNRLEMQVNQRLKQMVEKNIAWLETQRDEALEMVQQIINEHENLKTKHELLRTIPGLGDKTIGVILAHIDPERFESARKLAAFIGLNPRQRLSGTSVKGRARLSKTGNPELRKAFYMPALVAMKHNPVIKRFTKVLHAKNKAKKAVVGAAMRKLVHIVYGVLKSRKNFQSSITAA